MKACILPELYMQFPEYNNKPVKYGTDIDIWLTLNADKLISGDSANIY